MLLELGRRNEVVFPFNLTATQPYAATSPVSLPSSDAEAAAATATSPLVLFVVGCPGGRGGDMMGPLIRALRQQPSGNNMALFRVTVDPAELAAAQKVLVLLSEGVLAAGSDSLALLERAMEHDRSSGSAGDVPTDRLVFVCRTIEDGWVFGNGNPEVANSPAEIRGALNDHEAVTYRPPVKGELDCGHEFSSMIKHLINLLMRGKARWRWDF